MADPDLDLGYVCSVCLEEKKSLSGLVAHCNAKHDGAGREAFPPAERAKREAKPRGAPSTSRRKRLEGSMAILVLGAGMVSPPIGEIWTPAVPPIAHALDECAKEYAWAKTLCDFMENAGPVSLLVSALAPPIIQTLVYLGIVPARMGALAGMAGGPGPSAAQPATPGPGPSHNGNGQPTMNPDGSIDIGGLHFSSADVAATARQIFGDQMTGPSGPSVYFGDSAPPPPAA